MQSNYEYDLSEIKWSQLIPQKVRNRIIEHFGIENTNNIENVLFLLPNKKSNFRKTIDMMFYHINFFIMKTKTIHIHIVMGAHAK